MRTLSEPFMKDRYCTSLKPGHAQWMACLTTTALLLSGSIWMGCRSTQALRSTPVTMERVRVSGDSRGFELTPSGVPFRPWGFNYDHDRLGRLIEDYWHDAWASVEEDFIEMKSLGANVVRIHLQLGRFMNGPDAPNRRELRQLSKLLGLAERTGLYLDLTGLGCYHKADVPAWYDALTETARWEAQSRFWEAIARVCRPSPAVFCYDLMNEPVAPGGDQPRTEWLGPPFAGKHFVQFIALDRSGRSRTGIARAWIRSLTSAIRHQDTNHLITVGLVDWSLDRPGLTSGFVPSSTHGDLDFISVHLYPRAGKVGDAVETLRGFDVGKPVMIEETFSLYCGIEEFKTFHAEANRLAAGWIGFYWGKTREELSASGTLQDALLLQWLNFFAESKAP
jgi:hypothetical protein